MSRKIIGVTVGTPLPKPNFDQTDPRKGDYIKGDRSFITPDETLTQSGRPAEAKAVGDAIVEINQNIANSVSGLATKKYVDIQDVATLSEANLYSDNQISDLATGFEEVILGLFELEDNKDVTEEGTLKKIREIASEESSAVLVAANNYVDSVGSGKADKVHTHDNYVPTTRKINNKALTNDIDLTAEDVGALPNNTKIPSKLSDLTADATHRTVTDTEKQTWNAKSNFSGSYNDLTNKPTIPSISGLATTESVDSKINTAIGALGDTYYTEGEINDKVSELNAAIAKKSDFSGDYNDLSNKPTIPSISGLATKEYVDTQDNKKVDKVSGKGLSTNDYTTAEKNKLSGIADGAQVNTVTGVKGSSESNYRTGNINITKANIGLGNVDNTADEDKEVKYATTAGSATSATKATQDASGNVIISTYETKTDSAKKLEAANTSVSRRRNTVIRRPFIPFQACLTRP